MKKNLITNQCEVCQEQFKARLSGQRYCSRPCRDRAGKLAADNARQEYREQSLPENHSKPDHYSANEKICANCYEKFTKQDCSRGWPLAKFCQKCRKKDPKELKAEPRECIQCKKQFRPSWGRKEAKLCSRKCQGIYINANGLGPRIDDEELEARLIAVIKKHDRCLSQEELMHEAGTSHKVISKRGWTVEYLYEKAGRAYEAPILKSRFEDRVHSVLLEIFPLVDIETDKPLPQMHGFKEGELRADNYIKDLNLIVEADGSQHVDGGMDIERLDYIRTNDRLKDEYAAANGITLIRIPETVDRRAIKTKLLRGIRRARPGFRPLNPSNAGNSTGSARRMPKRRNVSDRPGKKRGDKGEPHHDIYCRGCHSRPSFSHRSTYLCASCWERFRAIWLHPLALPESEVPVLKEKIMEFIKSKGRYVWQSEVHLNFPAYGADELKKHGIKVAVICREMGLFAPEDDRVGRETVKCVKEFARAFMDEHKRPPGIREVTNGIKIDHTTVWSYMDYDAFMKELGGRAVSNVRYRYPTKEDFLNAAAEVVRKKGESMPMTEIVEACGICYPAYLEHFKTVRREHIHDQAGVPCLRKRRKT